VTQAFKYAILAGDRMVPRNSETPFSYKSWHENPTGWERLSQACNCIIGDEVSPRIIKNWLIENQIDWQQITIIDITPNSYCFFNEDLEESWRRFYQSSMLIQANSD
jgi:hypothetical protein